MSPTEANQDRRSMNGSALQPLLCPAAHQLCTFYYYLYFTVKKYFLMWHRNVRDNSLKAGSAVPLIQRQSAHRVLRWLLLTGLFIPGRLRSRGLTLLSDDEEFGQIAEASRSSGSELIPLQEQGEGKTY